MTSGAEAQAAEVLAKRKISALPVDPFGIATGERIVCEKELCRQLKDTKQPGGRSFEQLLERVSSDDLVGWRWNRGEGRSLLPLPRGNISAGEDLGFRLGSVP